MCREYFQFGESSNLVALKINKLDAKFDGGVKHKDSIDLAVQITAETITAFPMNKKSSRLSSACVTDTKEKFRLVTQKFAHLWPFSNRSRQQ